MANYQLIVIGAGPGGIFSAYELTRQDPSLKIAVFEAGHSLDKRRCPIDGKKIKSCIGCKSCVMACPFGAVSVATTQVPVLMGDVRVGSQTKSFVLKCDLCVDRPGGPACAEACPTKGLTLVDEERLAELTAERARATIENEA